MGTNPWRLGQSFQHRDFEAGRVARELAKTRVILDCTEGGGGGGGQGRKRKNASPDIK